MLCIVSSGLAIVSLLLFASIASAREVSGVGGALKVSSNQPGWIDATFTNPDDKLARGWVREEDLFPPTLSQGAKR